MRPLWLALLVISTGTLEAQTVRGQLVDSISRSPLAGAFLTLVDERGVEHARAITDGAGQFVLTAPAAGTFHVRSKLIGFKPYVSPALTLLSGEATTYNAAIDPIPVALKEVVVAGESECDVESGASVAALWQEVREALAAVAWTARESGYWYKILHIQRELTAGGRPHGPDSTWREIGYQRGLFKSDVPAAQLEAQGFVVVRPEGWTYYGPDADVLLSDPFLRTHCFETKTANGLVGLAFTPVRNRTLPDIKGTLWVDRDNAQLRYLEFSYTQLPERIIDPRAGGRIEFMRLPTGAWIVRQWVIRTPIARIVQMNNGQDAFPQIVGFHEAGGSAVEIKSNNGTVVYQAEVAPAPAVAVVVPAEPQPMEKPAAANPIPAALGPAVGPPPAPPARETVHVRPKRGSGDRDLLQRDEFEGSTATDAFSLVQQFRPNWLHSRGPLSLADPTAGDLKIYVDGFLFGDVSGLHNVPVLEVQRLRHLSGPDATMRYGVGHGGGVIEVWTRRS
ncbi:MAG TPA: carboxypeptidase-like regulatory domain-containing protein [Gemmatimonadales bacterium]|nr:carboxypeptidase-like regulatory domain-containing protein [Gemmatimonadales bacterium]